MVISLITATSAINKSFAKYCMYKVTFYVEAIIIPSMNKIKLFFWIYCIIILKIVKVPFSIQKPSLSRIEKRPFKLVG